MSDTTSGGGSGRPKKKPAHAVVQYQGDYDPARFIVPASDTKGHAEKKSFRLSVSIAREIKVIINSKLFPFVDESDLLRWCVHYGLEKLNSMEDIPHSVFAQAEAAIEITRELVFHKQYAATFAAMDEAIQICTAHGAFTEIRKLYGRVLAKFQAMPAGHWRTEYLGELARRYGHLVDPKAARERAKKDQDRIHLADESEVG